MELQPLCVKIKKSGQVFDWKMSGHIQIHYYHTSNIYLNDDTLYLHIQCLYSIPNTCIVILNVMAEELNHSFKLSSFVKYVLPLLSSYHEHCKDRASRRHRQMIHSIHLYSLHQMNLTYMMKHCTIVIFYSLLNNLSSPW